MALIVFNRPDHTRRVFSRIAESKPIKLFVIADGPRNDLEAAKCRTVRDIVQAVTWDCEVFHNVSETNLGCKARVATGIDWVFDHVDRAIILEDDCVPHLDFFRFCGELLDRYQDNPRIMQISGNNLQLGTEYGPFSYYFGEANVCWGWATWKRAWQLLDIGMSQWPALRATRWLDDILDNQDAAAHYRDVFEQTYQGQIDTWDYQWNYTCWLHNGLSVVPNRTLVANIGFGSDATHTKDRNHVFAHLPVSEMTFPLRHPPYVRPNKEADRFVWATETVPPPAAKRGVARRLMSRLARLRTWCREGLIAR